MIINFKLKGAKTGSISLDILNDGVIVKNIPAALTVVLTTASDLAFTITTSVDQTSYTKAGNSILVDDINVTTQTAPVIASILQELCWQGTAKAKIDLYPKEWLRLLTRDSQTAIQYDDSLSLYGGGATGKVPLVVQNHG